MIEFLIIFGFVSLLTVAIFGCADFIIQINDMKDDEQDIR